MSVTRLSWGSFPFIFIRAFSNSLGHNSPTGNYCDFFLFPAGHGKSNGKSGSEGLADCCLMDLKNGTELVLTYEDKDRYWMLVGDVPWR
jgi:hypothetical protein